MKILGCTFCLFSFPYPNNNLCSFDFSRKLVSTQPEKFINAPDNNPGNLLIFILSIIYFFLVDKQLLGILVGDALVEPFWPLGTGANRAILASQDAAWSVKV